MRSIELDIHWQATPPTEEEGLREWGVGPRRQICHDRRTAINHISSDPREGVVSPSPGHPQALTFCLQLEAPCLP